MKKYAIVVLFICIFTAANMAFSGTVAYWRFEGDGAPPTAGETVGHTANRTTSATLGGPVAIDVSGNGNTLYAWNDSFGGLLYTDDVSDSWTGSGGTNNDFSVENADTDPRAFTWSTQSSPSGVDIDTMQPLAWTIEASIYLDPSAASGWRTFVGRDGFDVAGSDGNAACLYFQKTTDGYLRINFVDVDGTQWTATDSAPFLAGRWYHVAAVSDGSELRLYKWDTIDDAGYALVAATDISSSADARLRADIISDTALPLDSIGDPMNWSVGSGMWNSGGWPENGHVDRWIGKIDEVRISNHALDPSEFLFVVPMVITEAGVDGTPRLWLEWESSGSSFYRITSKTNLTNSAWMPEATGIAGTPPVNSWTSDVLSADHAFYRVEHEAAPTVFDLDPATVLNTINENVYGHFFEHIYHSANGGLWGDLIWNRSFELNYGTEGGVWTIDGSDLVQSSLSTDVHLEFGDPAWTDYELTLEAQKQSGDEGFLILFRVQDENNFYWLNLGGWGNTQHAIEKEVNGGRSLVSSQIAGTIDTPPPTTWYDIRIRCEGNRFQCWLDDVQIFDITDTGSPFLSGAVGVGTWATSARYRNIVVTDVTTSNVLYSGLPTPPPTGASDFWLMHGTGTGTVVTNALNNNFAVEVSGSGSETGLQQDNFKFIPQLYSGSLWMKGSVPAGVKVEFLDGSNTLAQTTLSAPTSSWAEYPFSLTPSSGTDDGSLRITLLGAGTVTFDQISMMGQDSIDTGGYRPDLLEAVTNLSPPIIRWPGGCFASLYLWKDAIGPQHQRRIYSAYMWEDQDINSYGTDEFIRMCEQIGTEPLLVINTGILDAGCGAPAQFKLDDPADYLPYALDWMEYCNGDTNTTWGAVRAANGHPAPYNVTYWEIDNETWAAGSAAYIAAVQEFAPAMRAKAAELGTPIKLIAVGSGGYDQSWNQDILDNCATNIDYISVHYYENPANFATAPLSYENYIIDLATRISASSNTAIEIYNSEWNAQSIDLRTGLFAGGLLNVYERQGDVFTLGGPALFLRHTSAGGWNNAFMNFDHTGWFPAPNYIVMKLWRDHYAPYRIDAAGTTGDLNLVATKSGDGSTVYVKVVNPSASERTVQLNLPGGTTISGASFDYVTAPSLTTENTLNNPSAVSVETGSATVNGAGVSVALPAYSASVIEINL